MIRKIARPMLASVYIADGVDTLTNTQAHVDSTESVLKKVNAVLPRQYAAYIPNDPKLVARAVGGTKVGAGSLLAIGKAPRLSAGALALTAIPTILGRHAFWETQDAKEKSARRSGFLTSIALLGGLGITAMDTQGKPGLRWRTSHAVQAALPGKSDTEAALDNAGEWISERANQAQEAAKQATESVSSYVDDNKDDWKKQAAAASAAAGTFLHQAREQGKSVAKDVQKNAPKWAEQAKEQSSQLLDQAQKDGRQAAKRGRSFLDDAQKDAKKGRKRVVKAADKAQSRAEDALDKADSKSGRALKRANKKAAKLQDKADKRIDKAIKKIG